MKIYETMKIQIKLIFLLIPFLLIGCKKHGSSDSDNIEPSPDCKEKNIGTMSLTPQERLIQPYRLNDSLVFINIEIVILYLLLALIKVLGMTL